MTIICAIKCKSTLIPSVHFRHLQILRKLHPRWRVVNALSTKDKKLNGCRGSKNLIQTRIIYGWREKNRICSMQKRGENSMKVISILNLGFMIFMFRSKSSIFQFCSLQKVLCSGLWMLNHSCFSLPVGRLSFGNGKVLSRLLTVDWRKLIGSATMML